MGGGLKGVYLWQVTEHKDSVRVTGCDGWVAGERAGVRVIEPFHLRELVLLHNAAVIKRMSLFLSCRASSPIWG